MKKALLILGLCCASTISVAADCKIPEAPKFNKAVIGSEESMIKTQDQVNAFLTEARASLKCVTRDRTYNNIVDRMHFVGNRYNRYVAAYYENNAKAESTRIAAVW